VEWSKLYSAENTPYSQDTELHFALKNEAACFSETSVMITAEVHVATYEKTVISTVVAVTASSLARTLVSESRFGATVLQICCMNQNTSHLVQANLTEAQFCRSVSEDFCVLGNNAMYPVEVNTALYPRTYKSSWQRLWESQILDGVTIYVTMSRWRTPIAILDEVQKSIPVTGRGRP
jgi:hypothetical protein